MRSAQENTDIHCERHTDSHCDIYGEFEPRRHANILGHSFDAKCSVVMLSHTLKERALVVLIS
jgi:hypothetical protein